MVVQLQAVIDENLTYEVRNGLTFLKIQFTALLTSGDFNTLVNKADDGVVLLNLVEK